MQLAAWENSKYNFLKYKLNATVRFRSKGRLATFGSHTGNTQLLVIILENISNRPLTKMPI